MSLMMKLRHKESTLPKVTMKAADRDSDPTLTPNFVCAFCLSPLLPVLKTSPPTTHLRSLQKRLVQILVSFFPRGTEAWTSRDRLPFSLVPREEKGKCASFILVFPRQRGRLLPAVPAPEQTWGEDPQGAFPATV